MFNPVSTYRLQFNKEFTLKDFKAIVPYLKKLGVSTIYASPILAAIPGSMHGYDGVNPHQINPEIGTEEELKAINKILKEHGMQWLQDIVPNHMSYHPNNRWLMDVLEKGNKSKFFNYFDIDWSSPLYDGRVMAPFLGASLDDVIGKGELTIEFIDGRLVFKYYDAFFPLSPHSYEKLFNQENKVLPHELQQILDQIKSIQNLQPNDYGVQWENIKEKLFSFIKADDLQHLIQDANKNASLLKEISFQQVYALCGWQETDSQINFRRFFTINSLLCLNIQDPEIFATYHKYIFDLMEAQIFQGLRIDHIDGLSDPGLYLNQLRELAGPEAYIVVEKILKPEEDVPKSWPIQGNTGYDFLALANNLLSNKRNEKQFANFYKKLSNNKASIAEQVRQKKTNILFKQMAGELENLTRLFIATGLPDHGITRETIKQAIAQILIYCPVYRYYGNAFPLDKDESAALKELFDAIQADKPKLVDALSLIQRVVLDVSRADERTIEKGLQFYQRLMQFSGPLMAKGVEDTLMYTYNSFIGSNEVGNSPEYFAISPDQFHAAMVSRQAHWPLSLNATATHDTKRGEDVSARLNAITDLPEEWFSAVETWQELNRNLKVNGAPDANDEYFIYQTLLGTFPFGEEDEKTYEQRLHAYLVKAVREGKVNSNWAAPDEAYEKAVCNFTSAILDKTTPFWESFDNFFKRIADFGIINTLSKVALKFTCPGVPDVYQGCELWDFSMVDPDNRRPVNYTQRLTWIDQFTSQQGTATQEAVLKLWEERSNANIKLWLVHLLLKERKGNPDFFEKAEYVPLATKGKYKDHVFAFARRHKQEWFVVVLPLNLASLCKLQKTELKEINWKDTQVLLPAGAPQKWENLLVKNSGKQKGFLALNDIFTTIPIGILRLGLPETDRGAGILMHISSLPSAYGIGDFGKEARSFADFLHRSHQKYWQILPLNITEKENAHSPYSSISSMAGNTLFICPEMLAAQGLLHERELAKHHLPTNEEVDFQSAMELKVMFLSKAFDVFQREDKYSEERRAFENFSLREKAWLDDFALYVVIKNENGGKPWFQWPSELKNRQEAALKAFSDLHEGALKKIKWQQYMFSVQWHSLKAYCNNLGLQLFGDLPFYVSYDSADVWANPEIFSLDEEGKITGVAGVPPDYFNSDGQLWGMPVFNWEALKIDKYNWWIRRIRKNLELFDILRLDHFRAFYDYWQVPATEKTAKQGTWQPGPGADFFQVLKETFGDLPFIAEDLGDINEGVNRLRDDFKLPGMKILQFAFSEDMPDSIYIPHNYNSNYFVYTGTHDNNTTLGWFRQDAGKEERSNIEAYTSVKPTEKNIYHLLAKLAYASVAKTAIIPMQDVLGLDETSRMNIPSSTEKNWLWRMKKEQLTKNHEEKLRTWVNTFNR